MQVLPDYNKPYIIDSLTAPVVIKHNWIFNAIACDFMLNPITYLEETTGGAVLVRINGTEFWVPAPWYILVTDLETYQIDTVNVQDCAKKKHEAFAFNPDDMKLYTLGIDVLETRQAEVNPMSLVHPAISKGTALVHPVGPMEQRVVNERQLTANGGETNMTYLVPVGPKINHLSVVIGPHDLYKYLANKVVGDIFTY